MASRQAALASFMREGNFLCSSGSNQVKSAIYDKSLLCPEAVTRGIWIPGARSRLPAERQQPPLHPDPTQHLTRKRNPSCPPTCPSRSLCMACGLPEPCLARGRCPAHRDVGVATSPPPLPPSPARFRPAHGHVSALQPGCRALSTQEAAALEGLGRRGAVLKRSEHAQISTVTNPNQHRSFFFSAACLSRQWEICLKYPVIVTEQATSCYRLLLQIILIWA